jgi:hypothetical protein
MPILNIWDITNKINIDSLLLTLSPENCPSKGLNEHILSNRFLLNTENRNMSLLESVVYDIARFHFKRLNIQFNITDHFIEFYFTSSEQTNSFHVENSEVFLKTITYFSSSPISETMDIITNVTSEQYKYKDVFDNIFFYILFPDLLKHISFEGNKYYHTSHIEKSNNAILSLHVNLLNKLPSNPQFFSVVCNSENKTYEQLRFVEVNVDLADYRNELTNEFIEDILYNPSSTKYDEIININKKISSRLFVLYKKYTDELAVSPEITCVMDNSEKRQNSFHENDIPTQESIEILFKERDNVIDIHSRKFLQRVMVRNKIPKYVCNWIIKECEPYFTQLQNEEKSVKGLIEKRCNIIDVEKIKSIFYFILELFNSIIVDIIDHYSIDKQNTFIIDDIYIQKNNSTEQNTHTKDKLEVKILLSDILDEYMFDDGICSTLEMGDIIIFTEHSNFTKKELNQYCLIGKITIKPMKV